MIKRNLRIIKRNTEIWKEVKGYPDYQISNMGRVKSFKNNSSKLLKMVEGSNGYSRITLQNEKSFNFRIHILIISHFGIPKPSPIHQCNHKDGDKSNNWNTNLEWMTPKQNNQHARATGLNNQYGANQLFAKLTDKIVKKIRKSYGDYSQEYLGKLYRVSQSVISNVVNNQAWKHV